MKKNERELAIQKIIKAFEMLNEGLDKGRSIKPKSEMHNAIKLLLSTWMEIQSGSEPESK